MFFSLVGEINAKAPTSNILSRVLAIRVGSKQGTAFTVDVESKQYLVTARHLFMDTASTQIISVLRDTTWINLRIVLVAPLSDSVDIAVMAPPFQLTTSLELPASTDGMVIGQEAFFLGFPSMLRTVDEGRINRGFPFPFIKHAVISALGRDQFGTPIIYLDGHNNCGFSGGPVIFWHQEHDKFYLAGIIKGFRPERLLLPDSNQVLRPIDVFGNSGIVIATDVSTILQVIEQNPIGAQLPK